MPKILKIELILFLLYGISGCSDEDYVHYFDLFYINQTGFDFKKIEVYRSNQKGEYTLNSEDTLILSITDDSTYPITMLYADSAIIHYNDTIKKYIKGIGGMTTPLHIKGYDETTRGSHNNYHNCYYTFKREDLE